ncbi:MAG: LacI family DNA-binding transcriptional regulator [Capsulimonadaceae bacterium]|nr:LacI family DNA-binding transcriptional regulator [Capsulimonadaceae bacterium]
MITLDDVAKQAGVSTSTVSIVVNNRHVRGVSVSPATRERVLHVAREMGYTPNSLARAVATGKNRVLGFIKDDLAAELAMRIMVGAQQECEIADYLIKPFQLSHPAIASDLVRKCLGQRVAGIIVVNLPDDALAIVLHEAKTAEVPVVMVDSPSPNASCIQITSDAEQGVRLMCGHLVEQGHKRIAFIGGPADSVVSQERKRIFRDACLEYGLDIREDMIVDTSWGETDIVKAAVAPLLARPVEHRPTALFCAGDAIAMMSVKTARRCGLRVPKDVSVTGYSNASYAYLCDPALTTVAQDFVEMGRIAVRHVLALAADKDCAAKSAIVKVPTSLVVRESTWGPDWV